MTSFYKWTTAMLWTAVFALIAFFFVFVFRFSFNFPYYDDFENIVEFTHKYIHTNSFADKAALLFEQNFEHRVLFSRILTLLQYWSTGQINIRWLIVLGDLSLIALVVLFGMYHRRKDISLLALLSITCLLFQAQHYEDSVSWATCSLQHAPCILFSLLSFHLVLRKRNLYLSAAFAALALFTSANGLSAVMIWLVIVFFKVPNRKTILAPASMLIAVTLLHVTTLTVHSGSLGSHIIHDVVPKLLIFLSFAGQLADTRLIGSMLPSVVLGAIFLLPLVLISFKMIRGKAKDITDLQWLCAAGLLSLCFVSFLIVFARGDEADYVGYLMDRYKIYAALFAILAVAFYDNFLKENVLAMVYRLTTAAASFTFCISTYYLYYENFAGYRSTIEANQFNYLWSRTVYYPVVYSDQKTGSYMPEAQRTFLKSAFLSAEQATSGLGQMQPSDPLPIKTIQTSGIVTLSNNVWNAGQNVLSADLFVMAVEAASGRPRYMFTAETGYQKALKQFATTFTRPRVVGFRTDIFTKKLDPGKYWTYLVQMEKGKPRMLMPLGPVTIN